MPNAPEPAARRRAPPTDRRNAEDDHEGSPHRPEEFDSANPAKQVPGARISRKTPGTEE